MGLGIGIDGIGISHICTYAQEAHWKTNENNRQRTEQTLFFNSPYIRLSFRFMAFLLSVKQ